ncbi:putative xylitol oxidase [Catellatospora methionotrophica]|uniref:Putative xylitol oxidase n=1 Tax=Catellatospora methionotrophica TaxID=121620 RepID=A0A8J3LHW4_9ACTN|nr:FAD-binding protein [Catellatospora methionotrophica]GIG19259.1 putative xylitol oxidase [Catellatospora methionotrophica]
MATDGTNWAGNVTFRAARLHRPVTVDELRGVVAGARQVRALGTGHSFNRIADTPYDLVTVARLPRVAELDRGRSTVRVSAGTRYGELAPYLHRHGYALHNLGSLPHISIAGAVATGTHGSGDRNGNLATAVRGMELVTADGELVTVGTEDLPGSVVSLGALGVVTALDLAVVPTFEVRQRVYEHLPRAALEEHFDEVFGAAYSVSLFTRWRGPDVEQVWLKQRAGAEPIDGDLFGARPADGARHPIVTMSPVHCTPQLGEPGPWHERLPHFRLDFTPSAGDELQSEYFVPRSQALAAFAALDEIADRIALVVQVSEVRSIAADELWLSPAYGRDSIAFHFTWIADEAAVAPVVGAVEDRLIPLGARPHWGKVFGIDPALIRAQYPRLPDFTALTTRLDPEAKFRNPFLTRHLP